MKSILISIKPKYVAKILNGETTIEIRKTMPKCCLPIDVYIYCTNGKEKWWRHDNLRTFGKLPKNVEKQFCAYGRTARELDDELIDFLFVNGIRESISRGVNGTLLNGSIVAKFTLNKVEEIDYEEYGCGDEDDEMFDWYFTKTLNTEELQEKSCLKRFEIANYLQREIGYAWHISNLEVFDKPKELSEFENYNMVREVELNAGYYKGFDTSKITVVKKAPQSWCYVEPLL